MRQGTSGSSPKLTGSFIRETQRSGGLELSFSGTEPAEFTRVTTDSRKVGKGDLFVAIKGEAFDGHAFVNAAIAAGAAGALFEAHAQVCESSAALYRVSDSLAGYRALAHGWRKAFSIPVIAVAGSNGKTTTKELLSAILSARFGTVLKTTGSQNGFVGIPLTLLELEPAHRVAVIEIGIDEIGAMAKHMDIVNPSAAVLTSIGPEHLEKLQDVDTVAREEAVALERVAASGGTVAIQLDDPHIRPLWTKLKGGKRIGYTLTDENFTGDVCRGRLAPDGGSLSVTGPGLESELVLELPLLGRHNAMNLLGAVALALAHGLSAEEIRRGLGTFQGAPGRSQVRELPSGTVVLCDYYNASPPSVAAGLDLLSELARKPKTRRRIACLADMRELGAGEERFHRELAPRIIDQGVENVLLFGPLMRTLADELHKRGFRGEKLEHFGSRPELARALVAITRPGDAILIKGSHSMKMEEIFQALEAAGS